MTETNFSFLYYLFRFAIQAADDELEAVSKFHPIQMLTCITKVSKALSNYHVDFDLTFQFDLDLEF